MTLVIVSSIACKKTHLKSTTSANLLAASHLNVFLFLESVKKKQIEKIDFNIHNLHSWVFCKFFPPNDFSLG